MTYLQPRRKPGLNLSMPVRIGVLVVVFLFGSAFFFPYMLQATVQTVAYPFWQFNASIRTFFGGASSSLITKTSLLEENNRLRQELRSAEHLEARALMLSRENKELKKLFGRSAEAEGVLAPIVARPPRLSYDTLILGVGLTQAIEAGDRVYLADDVVIGEVTAVYPQTSLITLFSTPGRQNDVRIGTSTAMAVGLGLGAFVISVPRELSVATGTPVTMPGLLPSLLGIVKDKEAHPADPVERLYVQSPYSLDAIDFVRIIPRAPSEEVDEKEVEKAEKPVTL